MSFRETARAKINLTLRVHGRRADGYHEIESLVAFAEIGDRVVFTPGAECRVVTSGPFAGDIDGPNLLDRRWPCCASSTPSCNWAPCTSRRTCRLRRGSAADRPMSRRCCAPCGAPTPSAPARSWHELAARLGADVPVCLAGTPALISGIGERIEPLGSASQCPLSQRSWSIRGCPCRRPRSIRPSPQDLLQPGASGQRCRRPWPTCRALSASWLRLATTSSDRRPRSCRPSPTSRQRWPHSPAAALPPCRAAGRPASASSWMMVGGAGHRRASQLCIRAGGSLQRSSPGAARQARRNSTNVCS